MQRNPRSALSSNLHCFLVAATHELLQLWAASGHRYPTEIRLLSLSVPFLPLRPLIHCGWVPYVCACSHWMHAS